MEFNGTDDNGGGETSALTGSVDTAQPQLPPATTSTTTSNITTNETNPTVAAVISTVDATGTTGSSAPSSTEEVVESSENSLLDSWGAMGGGIGEDNAFLTQQHHHQQHQQPSYVGMPSTPYAAVVPNQHLPQPQQQQQQQYEYASTSSVFLAEQQQQQQQPPTPTSQFSGGSITRFAAEAKNDVESTSNETTYISPFAKPVPKPPLSFAERSQQAYINSGTTLSFMPVPPTATGTHPPTSTQTPTPHLQHHQQQQQQIPSPARMYGAAGNASHIVRTAPYGATTPGTPVAAAAVIVPPVDGRPTIRPGGYSPNVPPPSIMQNRLPVVPAVGSYAARSAEVLAYGQHQQLPPNMYGSQQHPQPQPQYGAATGAAAGSVMSQHNSAQSIRANAIPTTAGVNRTGNLPYSGTTTSNAFALGTESTQYQQKMLTDSIRKVQEHAYYMKQAMEQKNLAVTLDRAAHMVGELGGPPHGHPTTPAGSGTGNNNMTNSGAPTNTGGSAKLTPKNYYDLYMRALEDMPLFEEYLYNLATIPPLAIQDQLPNSMIPPPHQQHSGMVQIVGDESQRRAPSTLSSGRQFTMKQLYDCVQYCPRVVSRLYLQIATGSALIRSGECSAKYVMSDLQDVVRCEQNPVRGLFLRYFLITALRDKLPDTPCPPPPLLQPSSTMASSNPVLVDGEGTMNDDDPTPNKEEKINENDIDIHEVDMKEEGTVKDSYEFVLSNFMEMNKLWVRIQHLPGEGKDKEARKRRERERNDLRILVGTNLVRLSQLESVTSKIYGENILPYILEHIVTTGDPLSQAYLMDCLVQVFPDEYHIETLPILLNVCPRLRDKVNIRTILQGLMDRLAKYLADKELLDESDTNQVKISLAKDSFGLFEECVQKVYNARGPKLTSKEVIRLQTALLQYSIKCFPGYIEQVGRCIDSCVTALQQANASYDTNTDSRTTTNIPNNSNSVIGTAVLDDASVAELEKLLSIPLDSLALKVLEFDTYSQLIGFLPWQNRREVAISLLKAVENSGTTPKNINDIEQLFTVIEPLTRDETSMNYPPIQQIGMVQQSACFDPSRQIKVQEENCYVAKLLHSLDHSDINVLYSMLLLAKRHLTHELSGPDRTVHTLTALVYATFRLANRFFSIEENPVVSKDAGAESNDDAESSNPVVKENFGIDAATNIAKPMSSRIIFVLIQTMIELVAKIDPERGIKLYADAALFADRKAGNVSTSNEDNDVASISYELLRLAMAVYEDRLPDPNCQCRCITSFSGAILALKAVSKENYESLITRTAQFAAKIPLKPEQCQLVALCAHLFYPADNGGQLKYSNPQRALECLQRSLKLADSCTTANPACIALFVDLLEHYVYFFEKKNPLITHAYITGLIALINEHLNSLNAIGSGNDAKAQFVEVVRYITKRKKDSDVAEMFAHIQIS